jgi:S-adenosylmethionine:tRNA ribosyltransferase-isomerase
MLPLSDYDFEFPREQIARYPAEPRDSARLLVVRRDADAFEDRLVSDLPDLLGPDDLMIVNDTRVRPARLHAVKESTGARAEVFLLHAHNARRWDTLVSNAKKLRPGDRLIFADDLTAVVEAELDSRTRTVAFEWDGSDSALEARIEAVGETPLPPYMGRAAEPEDKERYQTVFARTTGAVAAPTAGLHFTPRLLKRLDRAGVERATVTLHVGLGTFQAVEVEDASEHRMHAEQFAIPTKTADAVDRLRERGGRLVAVGTTVVRTLESNAIEGRRLRAGAGWTDAFIHPPYTFGAVDALMTNFHTPRSTLLMLVSALATREKILAAYDHAIREGYRLFSYGDAMLIL